MGHEPVPNNMKQSKHIHLNKTGRDVICNVYKIPMEFFEVYQPYVKHK